MRLRLFSSLCLLLLVCSAQAQLKVIKPLVKPAKRTNLAIGYGRGRSVVYLNRNVNEDNDARGHHLTLVYGGNRLIRFCGEFTHYKLKDIAPTWYTVKATTLEANIQFLARFQSNKALFYPIAGLSYNTFAGFFTGQNDFLNLRAIYPINERVKTTWIGLNVGTGFEYFFRPGSFYIDYKMRLGIAEGTENLNIMDVCFTAGLRYNLRAPSLSSIFRGTRGRYFIKGEE
jgi:hypothetical protein